MKKAETGISAPDFQALDSNGSLVKLSDYAGRKNVLFVFNRGFG